MAVWTLYHTGYHILPEPLLRVGRKNADFGQGFYLSTDEGFAGRWAMEHRGGCGVCERLRAGDRGAFDPAL